MKTQCHTGEVVGIRQTIEILENIPEMEIKIIYVALSVDSQHAKYAHLVNLIF
jgi:hypothetical protein